MAKKYPKARTFAVDTRFQKMARRAGGIPRDKAIERAKVEIEKVEPGFDAWLSSELGELTSLVANAQAAKAAPDWIEDANARSRHLHDISATLGFQLLSFIANSLCDILDSIEAGAECNMESIACHIDALNLARRKSYRRLTPEQIPELTRGLRRVVEHVAI